MANTNTESLGDLYVRLGFNLDDLNHEYVQIERSLRENLARLNRERNIIDLQARVDLTGLDEATDATRIFEIRQRQLQQQLEAQRQKMRLLNDALQDTINRTGENSNETQRAKIEYERARLAVARLDNQLQELERTQTGTTNNFSDMYDSIVSGVKDFNAVTLAIQKVIEFTKAAIDATKALVENYRELRSMSFKLNLPIQNADIFLQKVRLAGGEIEDIIGYVRGISDALVKGEVDDPEFIALEKYGAKIFDATGRLKDFTEIFEETRKAFEKAKAAGEEIEFLQMTGGESGVTDVIQAFRQWNEALAESQKIAKAKLDYESLRQADIQMALLTEQTAEFKKELSSIFEPAVMQGVQALFHIFHDATEWINENKEEIKSWGATVADVFAITFNLKPLKDLLLNYGTDLDKANEIFKNTKRLDEEWQRLRQKSNRDNDPLSQYSIQRIKAFKDELEDLRIDLDFDNDFQKSIAQANLWLERELTDKIHVSDQERVAIHELYNAKIEQAEKNLQDKLSGIWEDTAAIEYGLTHSAFEKQLYDIERWKNAQLEKSAVAEETAAIIANAAAKEADAFQREMDRIKGNIQSLEERIFEQEHSAAQNQMMRAQKDLYKYWGEGLPQNLIVRWYNNEVARINKKYDTHFGNADLEQIGNGKERISVSDYFYSGLLKDTEFLTEKMKLGYGNLQNSAEKAAQALSQIPQTIDTGTLQQLQAKSQAISQQVFPQIQTSTQIQPIVPMQPTTFNQTLHNNINLGGAYVFDDAMKRELVKDITDKVVTEVKNAVESATSTVNYGFGN